MEEKPLYKFRLINDRIERTEYRNYRKVKQQRFGKKYSCYVIINPQTKERYSVAESQLDIMHISRNVYSFNPSYENPARQFISNLKRKRIKAIKDIEKCKRLEDTIIKRYLQ